MLIARKPAKILNYKFMCAMLYIIKDGCKYKALQKKYGKWHIIYMKFSKWAKTLQLPKLLFFL